MPGSSTAPGRAGARTSAPARIAFRQQNNVGAQKKADFAAQWLAYAIPCRRFADVLAGNCARLGADVVCYSFIVVDSHHLLLAGLPAHSTLDLILLDLKSSDPDIYRKLTGRELLPTLRFAERLAAMGKRVWVRFTLAPGHTDDPANVEGLARFVAPMRNVEWVEVQPFHQLGAFKWKALNLDYKHANTPAPTPGLIHRVLGQFHAAGCNAR